MKLPIEKNAPGGLAGWLLARWRNRTHTEPRLSLLERISLAPRQTLCLVEAEGRRFLIASTPEGGPAFYPLDRASRPAPQTRGRVSW
ncbi:MAG TPA: flagellar biosynthetic protein FliO [Terracidiphilus sp.]|jgi:flagellar biogenesis protein FliO